jgi:hypothetical protein
LLPLDHVTNATNSALPSINADLREIKKPINGLINTSTDDEPLASRDSKERKKKERKKSKKALPGGNEESPVSGRKTRAQQQKSPKIEPEVKVEIKEEPPEEEKPSPAPVTPKVKKEEEDEIFSDAEKHVPVVNGRERTTSMHSPVKGQHPKTSPSGPSMLGLPDSKGLIVGVNTINYDASSSVRNKAKVKKRIIIFDTFN